MKRRFQVVGMSCAACSARVEGAVSSVEGVSECSVNLLTNSMLVSGGDDDKIIEAVKKAGYGAYPASSEEEKSLHAPEDIEEKTKKRILYRLIASTALIIPLMYFSMGYTMWGFPLPSWLAARPVVIAFIQLLLALSVMIINGRFFISGTRAAINLSPNMDTLVSLGSGASLVFSVVTLFKMIFSDADSTHMLHELYFESAAMILTFITLGKFLEASAKGKTTNAIKSLAALTPKTATVIIDGVETQIPSSSIKVGDIFVVRPGERVAVDGRVIFGESAVDESALTGESFPQEKSHGSSVYAATTNLSGYMRCEATKVGENTAMGEIIKMVTEATETKAPIARVADRVAKFFVPSVLIIAFITAVIWFFVNNSLGYALARGVSVLVISCPCAMGLATPVAIMVSSGIAAKGGVLFKHATAIELCGRARCVVLDKTGTVTTANMTVAESVTFDTEEVALLKIAGAVEAGSEHPVGIAILSYVREKGIDIPECVGFKALSGSGVFGVVEGAQCYAGSYKFISESFGITEQVAEYYDKISESEKNPIFFVRDKKIIGIISLADEIRDDSICAIRDLRELGMHTVMLTGDNKRSATAVGKACGVDEVIAECMPADKERVVREISARQRVIMVGDGINDAPALTTADVGIAIGRGTDVAIESADVVLVSSSLSSAVSAVRIGRATLKNIHENLFWAFFYNIVGIPVAAGAFASFGFELAPMFSALAMSLSSFTVVMNALRLNLKKYFKKCDKTKNYTVTEGEKMVKTLMIEGMMCPHCEARVREVLLGVEGVLSADVSHQSGTAVLTFGAEVSDAVLKEIVTSAGYKVKEIK